MIKLNRLRIKCRWRIDRWLLVIMASLVMLAIVFSYRCVWYTNTLHELNSKSYQLHAERNVILQSQRDSKMMKNKNMAEQKLSADAFVEELIDKCEKSKIAVITMDSIAEEGQHSDRRTLYFTLQGEMDNIFKCLSETEQNLPANMELAQLEAQKDEQGTEVTVYTEFRPVAAID